MKLTDEQAINALDNDRLLTRKVVIGHGAEYIIMAEMGSDDDLVVFTRTIYLDDGKKIFKCAEHEVDLHDLLADDWEIIK